MEFKLVHLNWVLLLPLSTFNQFAGSSGLNLKDISALKNK